MRHLARVGRRATATERSLYAYGGPGWVHSDASPRFRFRTLQPSAYILLERAGGDKPGFCGEEEGEVLGEGRQVAGAAASALRDDPGFATHVALATGWARSWWGVFAGRFVSVWLPSFVLFDAGSVSARKAMLAVFPALVWALAAEPVLRSTPRPLRPATTGLVVGPASVASILAVSVWTRESLPGVLALIGYAIGTSVTAAAFEAVLVRVASRSRVFVIGSATAITSLRVHLDQTRDASIDVVGSVRCTGTRDERVLQALEGVTAASEVGANVIVIADDAVSDSAISLVLDENMPFKVIGQMGFYESAFWCVPPQLLSARWFACLVHIRHSPAERPSKRVFDLLTASFGLLIATPLFLLVALAVSWTPGPVIYRQSRIGRGGRKFTIYKFRTMVDGAERSGEALLATQSDTRVTGVGRILRRTHLDELPQLWNVLRGEMSMVGPRPERQELIETLESSIPFWSRRLLTRPGVTGWAQLRCGYASDTDGMVRKLSHDLWYVRHQSLRLDLALCLLTVKEACVYIFGGRRVRPVSISGTLMRVVRGVPLVRTSNQDAAVKPAEEAVLALEAGESRPQPADEDRSNADADDRGVDLFDPLPGWRAAGVD